ncbi:MAG: 3-isopropylmalate dehydrogenase [Chloroflexi bacterium]|nr:3-isopropylmalate dehydrogenase [Chloroflexota bacterium]
MQATIARVGGDGIGPDVVAEGVKVLKAVGRLFGHQFEFREGLLGGIAIDQTGVALPPETLALTRRCDAVLLGAVGGPKWSDPRAKQRPEMALLGVRRELALYANIRPVKVYAALINASTLKPEVVKDVDLIILRELTGGLYFGEPKERRGEPPNREAVDTLYYSEAEITRLVRLGFELAQNRRKKLTSVDKANVLETSRLWREITHEVARDFPDVTMEDILVDACSMHLIRRPGDFDVIATENMFGDILSDEASMLAGSMGMLPSASIGANLNRFGRPLGLYEPIHGTAPDIAGLGIANPLATILSSALLLRYSLGLEPEAARVEAAVEKVLQAGYRTKDIVGPGGAITSTSDMGDLVCTHL